MPGRNVWRQGWTDNAQLENWPPYTRPANGQFAPTGCRRTSVIEQTTAIPLLDPQSRPGVCEQLLLRRPRVDRPGWYVGPKGLEQAFAEYCVAVKHATGVSNGPMPCIRFCAPWDIGTGDEAIVLAQHSYRHLRLAVDSRLALMPRRWSR